MTAFTLPVEEYVRDLDILANYKSQAVAYLKTVTDASEEEINNWLKDNLSNNGKFPFKDVGVEYIHKDLDKDRKKATTTLRQYVDDSVKKQCPMPPSFTTYVPVTVRKSILSQFILHNLDLRNKDKDKMFEYMQLGDITKTNLYNNRQSKRKILNNSVSGAHSVASTPIYSKSSHSSLTSPCRVTTSYPNACNEKLLAGNRYYNTPAVVLANLVTIVTNYNKEIFSEAAKLYDFHLPSTEEVMDMITYSTVLYFKDNSLLEDCREYLDKITALDRAAILYIGDLHHFAKYNDKVLRDIITSYITTPDYKVENPKEILEATNAYTFGLASTYCSSVTKGKRVQDLYAEDLEAYTLVATTAKHIDDTTSKNTLFFQALLRIPFLPNSVHSVYKMYRRVIPLSDTDSTVFTTQHQIQWYNGFVDFSEVSYKVGYTIVYLVVQLINHLTYMVSAYMGVDSSQMDMLEMKNEYYFPTLIVGNKSKHYFSYISAREGRVLEKLKLEVKGVHLRGSNSPVVVQNALESHMRFIMDKIMTDGGINTDEILVPIVKLEKEIIDGIFSGNPQYLRTVGIKNHDAYAQGTDNPTYKQYLLWRDVFSQDYGQAPQLPFRAVGINTTLDRPSKIEEFIESIKDQYPNTAIKLRQHLGTVGRNSLGSLLLPLDNVSINGIPKELIPVINKNNLVMKIMAPFYLLLESLGIFIRNDSNTRLISEEYSYLL